MNRFFNKVGYIHVIANLLRFCIKMYIHILSICIRTYVQCSSNVLCKRVVGGHRSDKRKCGHNEAIWSGSYCLSLFMYGCVTASHSLLYLSFFLSRDPSISHSFIIDYIFHSDEDDIQETTEYMGRAQVTRTPRYSIIFAWLCLFVDVSGLFLVRLVT